MDSLGDVFLTDGPYVLVFLAGYALRAFISHRRRRRSLEEKSFGRVRPELQG